MSLVDAIVLEIPHCEIRSNFLTDLLYLITSVLNFHTDVMERFIDHIFHQLEPARHPGLRVDAAVQQRSECGGNRAGEVSGKNYLAVPDAMTGPYRDGRAGDDVKAVSIELRDSHGIM
ncbi:hypothetical protein [Methylobacterium sp. Gmos1]